VLVAILKVRGLAHELVQFLAALRVDALDEGAELNQLQVHGHLRRLNVANDADETLNTACFLYQAMAKSA
jgi:hypothetical protein